MDFKFNKLLNLILVMLLIISFSGCNNKAVGLKAYNAGAEYYSLDKEVVAENDNLRILWNGETGEIKFEDIRTNTVWSTASSDTDLENITHPQLKSPILVTYLESGSQTAKTLNAYTKSLMKETFSASETDNGLKVTYYFENENISVPVSYILDDESFRISINTTEIREKDNKVVSVSVLPFICSVDNTASKEDNYLFVPSGSGVLVYPKSIGDGVVSVIDTQVYGKDRINGVVENTYVEDIKLPVYGAKTGNSALCAIISKGADISTVTTNVGSTTYGYSSVYASFAIRGYQYVEAVYMNSRESKKNLYNENTVSAIAEVSYYPLSGEKADYVGMAEVYRDYLTENKNMKKSQDEKLLNLKLLGGYQTRSFIFGIPYKKLCVLTDFNDVAAITDELKSIAGGGLNVNLIGFTPTGSLPGKIAGGFDISDYGKAKTLSEISDDKDINLYFDFDVLHFSEKGAGVSSSDSARTSINDKMYITPKDIATRQYITDAEKYQYIGKNSLSKISVKAIEKAKKWGIEGISFGSLSNEAYSDYSDAKFVAKLNTEAQFGGIFSNVTKRKLMLASVSANSYAAINSEHIYSTPTSSAEYQIYDRDIPFYQIVFKGIKSFSTGSINFASNPEKSLLKAVEVGAGLEYSLTADYSREVINSKNNSYYNAVYKDVLPDIKEAVEEYGELFTELKGATVTDYVIIDSDLRKTTFSNGISVIVNYGSSERRVDNLTVKAGGWLRIGG